MAAATTSPPGDQAGTQLGLPVHLIRTRRSCSLAYRSRFDWEVSSTVAFVIDAVSGWRPEPAVSSWQIMYGIGGERDLTEEDLEPVRYQERGLSGSATAPELVAARRGGDDLDALDVQFRYGVGCIGVAGKVAGFVDAASAPGAWSSIRGIWELRRSQAFQLHQRVMCCGVRCARRRPGRGAGRRRARPAVQKPAPTRSRPRSGQGWPGKGVPAALREWMISTPPSCCFPSWGSCPPTTNASGRRVSPSLRTRTKGRPGPALPGGGNRHCLEGEEGTFTICSFWLVTPRWP